MNIVTVIQVIGITAVSVAFIGVILTVIKY